MKGNKIFFFLKKTCYFKLHWYMSKLLEISTLQIYMEIFSCWKASYFKDSALRPKNKGWDTVHVMKQVRLYPTDNNHKHSIYGDVRRALHQVQKTFSELTGRLFTTRLYSIEFHIEDP